MSASTVTPEKAARLHDLVAEGYGDTAIARELDLSRGAVWRARARSSALPVSQRQSHGKRVVSGPSPLIWLAIVLVIIIIGAALLHQLRRALRVRD